MSIELSDDDLDAIGRLSDKAENFYFGPVVPGVSEDCLRSGLKELRDDLRTMYVRLSGVNPWDSNIERD